MPKDSLKDFLARVKALLRGERAPRPTPPAHPCRVCGDAGFYAVRDGWLCETDYPSFLRQTGRTVEGFRFVERAGR